MTAMAEPAWDVVVIGAGAAGLLAASQAAARGRRTLLLEKNRKPGVKILMSGGTRCNLTHATDNRGIAEAFGPPGRFLHSPLAALGVEQTIALFESEGVPTKVEETGKVFPVSNKAMDVLDALLRRLRRSGATLALQEPLVDVARTNDGFTLTTPLRVLQTRRVILTTGGQSYPGCGTTGDGYDFAARFGHTIVPPRPALVPVTVSASWLEELRGITLPDVAVSVFEHEKRLVSRRSSVLFAHFGLTGPAALDISGVISKHEHPDTLELEIDLIPTVPEARTDEYLRKESVSSGKKQLAVVLTAYLPRRLCDRLLTLTGQPVDRRAAALSRPQRAGLVQTLKRLRLGITGTLGFPKAEVTTGGIALDEIDSRSMRSKRVPDLFVAGEVLDLDGPIGGYNFQAAFSTGWLAGTAAAEIND
jgi:predicted Rossmann fold flavoprotein